MHTGMIWFDNSTESLSIKILKAVDYYVKKYGRKPDLCLVHPDMMDFNVSTIEMKIDDASSLHVRPYRPVLPGHIWIGIEDKN